MDRQNRKTTKASASLVDELPPLTAAQRKKKQLICEALESLEHKGLIRDSGMRRNGLIVYVTTSRDN
jgi:hypothetical protein